MRFSHLIVLCVCFSAQISAYGEAIRQPPSLEAGDRYRLAYVTSSTTTALSSDIDFYNNFVQENADAAPLGEWGLEWNAIAATETVTARENSATDPDLDESMPIFLLDGTELVSSYSTLWNAWIDDVPGTFDIDELGEPIPFDSVLGVSVWTGTGGDGLPFTFPSPRKAGPLGENGYSIIGVGDSDSGGWFTSTLRRNTSELHLYAISESLTAVPEQSGSFHALVLFSLLMNLRKTRRV